MTISPLKQGDQVSGTGTHRFASPPNIIDRFGDIYHLAIFLLQRRAIHSGQANERFLALPLEGRSMMTFAGQIPTPYVCISPVLRPVFFRRTCRLRGRASIVASVFYFSVFAARAAGQEDNLFSTDSQYRIRQCPPPYTCNVPVAFACGDEMGYMSCFTYLYLARARARAYVLVANSLLRC